MSDGQCAPELRTLSSTMYYISTSLSHRYSNVCPLFLEQPVSYHVLYHQNPSHPQDKNETDTLDSSPLLSLTNWLGSPLPFESFKCLLNKLPNFFIHYSYFRPSIIPYFSIIEHCSGVLINLFALSLALQSFFKITVKTCVFFFLSSVSFSSVQSLSRVRLFATHELQHARPPCPSPSPRVHSNSCPSSQ